jgi:hypothetical protein
MAAAGVAGVVVVPAVAAVAAQAVGPRHVQPVAVAGRLAHQPVPVAGLVVLPRVVAAVQVARVRLQAGAARPSVDPGFRV